MRRGLVLTGLGLSAICVAVVLWWGSRHKASTPTTAVVRSAPIPVLKSPPTSVSSPASENRSSTSTSNTEGLRERLRTSRNYAEFVDTTSPAAASGNAEAAYVTAKALKYCNEGLGRFFRKPDGHTRSLGEAQNRWAARAAGYQQEIVDIYDRCHAFLDDQERTAQLSSANSWLDRAVAAGYAPAEAEKADDMRVAALLAHGDPGDGSGGKSGELSGASRLAISAAASGDPDAVIKMANWVDPTARSEEDYGNLVSAWQLVACERGYDCGASSEWLRSLCNYDVQCASGQSFTDYLRRQLGSRFEDVQRLAAQIKAAVDAQDSTAIKRYL